MPDDPDRTPLPPVAEVPRLGDQICFALYSAALALNRTYARLLAELELTYPQYLVMLVLWEQEAPSVKAIGARLRLESGTLTPLLKRLEAAGLVERRRDKADERLVRIHLTPGGHALRARAGGVPERLLAAMERSVPEAVQLRDELLGLRDALDRAEAAQTA